jgi:hypothetical protein
MPIRPYLDGQWSDDGRRFDGETIRLMGIAFEMAVGSLGATPTRDDPLLRPWPGTLLRLRKPGSATPSVYVGPP